MMSLNTQHQKHCSLLLIICVWSSENDFNKKDSECVFVYLFKYMTGYCVSYKAHVLSSLIAVSSNFSSNQMRLNKSYILFYIPPLHRILYFTTIFADSNPTLIPYDSQIFPVSSSCHSTKCWKVLTCIRLKCEKTTWLSFQSSTCGCSRFLCLWHHCDIPNISASQNNIWRK